ncbi:hypothetical protein GOP47_0003088 [Adiantum capillus-veneris]|uniref:Uncharacterized protein n=1 Tax=Adiantum capillus-veneris TaxID=13818 RepID=A0A9D4VC55_ADICA|nr:hypothetical protein GOP47_0003088 [Adiantum capillus-veneris]
MWHIHFPSFCSHRGAQQPSELECNAKHAKLSQAVASSSQCASLELWAPHGDQRIWNRPEFNWKQNLKGRFEDGGETGPCRSFQITDSLPSVPLITAFATVGLFLDFDWCPFLSCLPLCSNFVQALTTFSSPLSCSHRE